MTLKSEWPAGTRLQKTALALPYKVWITAKVQAMKEERTFQELVAEALEEYLRKSRKAGK